MVGACVVLTVALGLTAPVDVQGGWAGRGFTHRKKHIVLTCHILSTTAHKQYAYRCVRGCQAQFTVRLQPALHNTTHCMIPAAWHLAATLLMHLHAVLVYALHFHALMLCMFMCSCLAGAGFVDFLIDSSTYLSRITPATRPSCCCTLHHSLQAACSRVVPCRCWLC